jgi:hypothetical protein
MATKRKFKNDGFEAIHSSASAMYNVGAIDKATMRSFDASCLATPLPLKPQQNQKVAAASSCQPLKLLAVVEKHGLEALA